MEKTFSRLFIIVMDIFVHGTNHSELFGCVSHNNDCVRVRTCSVCLQ